MGDKKILRDIKKILILAKEAKKSLTDGKSNKAKKNRTMNLIGATRSRYQAKIQSFL